MGGSCDAIVRRIPGGSRVINIPFKFWGLKVGETYRAVLVPASMPPGYPYYSFDVKLQAVGASARVVIPRQVPVEPGDTVNIWVGEPKDYGRRTEAVGRGYSQKEREAYLEIQKDILCGCAGKQIHNERVP